MVTSNNAMLLLQYICIMEFWRTMTSGVACEDRISMSREMLQSVSRLVQTTSPNLVVYITLRATPSEHVTMEKLNRHRWVADSVAMVRFRSRLHWVS